MTSEKTETTKKWFLREIAVPLAQGDNLDLREVQLAASSVVSSRPRSFEIFWDGANFELSFGAPTKEDVDHMVESYRQCIKVGIVNEDVGPSKSGGRFPAPRWLSRLDPSTCKFFFVGNAYGHAFCLYDVKRMGRLMTPLLLALRRSGFAWVQFLFFEHYLQRHLSELGGKMRDRYLIIDTPIPKVRSWRDEDGKLHTEKYTVDHSAKFGQFHMNFRKLNAHLTAKSGSRLIVMIIRGVVQPTDAAQEEELPFSSIEDSDEVRQNATGLPFGTIQTQIGASKIGERLRERWTTDPRILTDLVERWVFDVNRETERYTRSYLRDRKNLPFVILTTDEMGLLIHMPSSDVRGLRTTRKSDLPPPSSHLAMKSGIKIAGD